MTARVRAGLLGLLAVLTVVTGTGAVGVAPAGAAQITGAGWWWRLQTGQVAAVPPPPIVPEGGLFVQGSIDGASAIAAVRYALAVDETGPVLTLRFAEGGDTGASTALVLACPVAQGAPAWTSGGAQEWDAQPTADCTRGQALGAVTEDGTAMVWDLSAFAGPPVVDVVLVAGVVDGAPAGADGSVFTLAFEEPTATDLATVPAGSPIPPPPPPPPSTSTGGFVPAPVSGGAAPSFRPPAVTVAPALPPSQAAPATPAPTPRPAAPAQTAIGATPERDAPPRLLALLLLVLAGGSMLLIGGGRRFSLAGVLQGRRAPELAGAGESTVGGIGRFARQREGEPPTLL